ncbi:hypothetical protein BH11PLA2_BH11PLA2_46410 [soil metagenome]
MTLAVTPPGSSALRGSFMPTMRTLVRLAQRIHDAWQQRSNLNSDHDFHWRYATEAWNELQALRRRLHTAEVRGFVHCQASLREDFLWKLDELPRKLDELPRKLMPLKDFQGQSDQVPRVGDWVRELRALEDEFNEISIDDRKCTLRVTTESITLQGIELGPGCAMEIPTAVDWSAWPEFALSYDMQHSVDVW